MRLPQNTLFSRLPCMGLCSVALVALVACGGGNSTFAQLGGDDAPASVSSAGATTVASGGKKTIGHGNYVGETPQSGQESAVEIENPSSDTTQLSSTAPSKVADPQPTPAPIPSSTAPITNGSLTVSVATLRTSGVAPLSVYFDATSTTSSATTRPFDEIMYSWNFGEKSGPGVAPWGQGANAGVASRNVDRGPITGHVYEVPGTYTATLTAFDGVNTATKTVTITVTDPNVTYAAKVYCYSNSSNTADDPPECAGHHITTMTWETVIASIKSVGNNAYHRLKRGDTFTMSSSTTSISNNIDTVGPGIIGDYGPSSTKPVIALQGIRTSSDAAIMFGGPRVTNQSGWVIKDLTISGAGDANHEAVGISTLGTSLNLLALRVTGDSLRMLLITSIRMLDIWNEDADVTKHGHKPYDGLAVVDCDKIHNRIGKLGSTSTYPVGMYIEAERFWIAGNLLNLQSDSGRSVSHGIRVLHGYRFAIVHNTVAESGNFQLSFKIHAESASTFTNWATSLAGPTGDSGGMSRYGYIGDNKTWAAWGTELMSIGSLQDNDQGLVEDIIVEGNWFRPATGNAQQFDLVIEGTRVTARDNLFDLTGHHYHTGIYVGGAPGRVGQRTAVDTRIYNNTFRNDDASSDFAAVVADTKGKQLILKNNLASSLSDSAAVFLAGAVHSPSTPAIGDGAIVQSNNSTNSQIRSVDPLFTGGADSVTGWMVRSDSYAKDVGTPVSVWADFFGVARSPTAAVIGATEQ